MSNGHDVAHSRSPPSTRVTAPPHGASMHEYDDVSQDDSDEGDYEDSDAEHE